jgi:small subunit ribosomal protein S3
LGHKVNPNGFRLGVIKGWDSRWYANRNYKDLVLEDTKLRQHIRKTLANAGVARIEIERVAGTQISIAIHTAKPGIVIGRSGESVERLRQALEKLSGKKVRLSILEIRNPEVDATLVARSIAEQLEKRVSFRRAMKQAVQKAMRQGAKGIKVIVGGRLGGAEIARSEKEVEGSVPLQTLRANIDYGQTEALTTYGTIGVKVWIYHGDVLPERQRAEGLNATAATPMPTTGERPERGERGERGPRGGRGERGERGERGGRPGGAERGGGDRGPRRGSPGGPFGEQRPPRTPRPAGVAGPGTRGEPRGRQAPRPEPGGEVKPSEGRDLPPSGAVSPAPAAHEFPTSAANEPETAPEAETKPEPRTVEEREEEK